MYFEPINDFSAVADTTDSRSVSYVLAKMKKIIEIISTIQPGSLVKLIHE
jgi:hypothetical protein